MSVSMVDLAVRPPAPAELRRFIQGLGQDAVLDLSGRAYGEAGLAYLRLDEAGLLERLVRDPRLLRLPLVRWGQRVTAGPAEGAWRVWLDEARGRIPQ